MKLKKYLFGSAIGLVICFGAYAAYSTLLDDQNSEIDWLSENDKMLAELIEENKTEGIDWQAQADRMFDEMNDKNNSDKIDWQAQAEKMLDELLEKNNEGEIDWLSENDKMLAELIEENKTEGIDWQAQADRMFDEMNDKNNSDKIDWQAEVEFMLQDLIGEPDKTGLEYLESINDSDVELGNSNYIGTWKKISTFVNNKPEDHAVSTLVLKKDSYESSTSCLVTGKLSVVNTKMTMSVVSDGCNSGVVNSSFTFDYQVSKDGKTLTFLYNQGGFIMKEVFEKVR